MIQRPRVCFYYLAYGQGYFFYSGVSHLFIDASCVRGLHLEVETLEKSLYLSSPIGTWVSVDLICQGCELEISKILLTMDLRVMDMSEFNFILGMDWLTVHQGRYSCYISRKQARGFTPDRV